MAINIQEQIKQKIADNIDIAGLSDSQREEIVSKLFDSTMLKISTSVVNRLEDPERKNFLELLEVGDKNIIVEYLGSKIKDLPELVEKDTTETIEEFKNLSSS